MCSKHTSLALKQQCKTFHFARHNPERWEQEKETALLNNLHDAWERASTAEREAEMSKKSLKHSQQQASVFIICEDALQAYGIKKRLRDWRRG